MDAYLVTLVDRETGDDQRVIVYDRNPGRDWQEWIDTQGHTLVPALTIANPVVIGARRLPIKRPVHTVLPTAHAAAV